MHKEVSEVPARRFKAFISYSHAVDGQLAPTLQHALQSLAKPWYTRRACRIFRDKTSLAVTSALWPAIEHALLDSEFFILLASPKSAGSPWVIQEVERWCESRQPRDILLVLTDGQITWDAAAADFDWAQTTALPRCLSKKYDHQPLYLDMRWAHAEQHLSHRDPRFLEAVATLSSALRGLPKDDLIGKDVFEHRRTKRIVRSVMAVLLALTVTAVTASVRATRALRVAEQRRIQARGVAESIVFEVNTSLLGVPEATEARRALSEKAQGLLDVLGRATMDVRTMRAAMVRHGQLADEAIASRKPDVARRELLESLQLARQLMGQDAMSSEFRRDVSVCLSKLGEVSMAANDHVAAQRYFSQDVELTRELLARDPGSLRYRTDLAVSLEKLGGLCLAKRDFTCALKFLDEDQRIMRELHNQYPTNLDTSQGLAVALIQVGEMRVQRKELPQAREALAEAIALNRQIVQQKPNDARAARDLSVALLKLGDVDVALHAPRAARPSFEAALDLRRALLARSQADPSLQRDIAVVLGRVANAAFGVQDYQAGLAPMTEAISLYERLVAQDGANEEHRRELALNMYDLAGAEAELGRFAEARSHVNRSVDLFRSVKFQAPTSGPNQELFQALRRAGLIELELQDVAAAGKSHDEACALAKSVSDDALDDDDSAGLSFDLAQIARAHLHSQVGNRELGRRCAVEALRRLELLRDRNEQAREDKEVQDTLSELRSYVQTKSSRPAAPRAAARAGR